MLQVGGNSYLLEESLRAEYGGELGAQNLYGDLAVVFFVVREINSGHPAAAEFTFDGVRRERTLNQLNALSHSLSLPGHGPETTGEGTLFMGRL
jgi:hypothetical protein